MKPYIPDVPDQMMALAHLRGARFAQSKARTIGLNDKRAHSETKALIATTMRCWRDANVIAL